jgi:septum formation protein
MSAPSLILASSSQRRKEILEAMGLAFVIRVTDVDEKMLTGESPADMVLRLASAKAAAIPAGPGEIVIGADTAVVLGEECFGKPADFEDALRMLSALSGRTHQVMTGIAVASAASVATALSVTDVRFRDIGPNEVRRYWQSGEPQGKAGAYAIQGRGGTFVEAIMGSYTGVVGLPVFETARLLQAAGLDVLPAELIESQSGA